MWCSFRQMCWYCYNWKSAACAWWCTHACTLRGVICGKVVMYALYAFDSVCWYRLCAAPARALYYIACAWTLFFHNYLMLLLYCALCQYMSVLPVSLICCQWHAKCVPRELITRISAFQTADGILRCGLSVSILRFPLCGVRPRRLKWDIICSINPSLCFRRVSYFK